MHSDTSRFLSLPAAPEEERARLEEGSSVAAWSAPLTIPTYEPAAPEQLPMFFERRVYQGSSGRVYPLPFTERISAEPRDRPWQAVHLENEWVRLVLLPELGGRIHVGYDKSADYDFFYGNNVIKPALVGLAGPWISGGVEFNWPQHHRPATFLPMCWNIEREEDGAVTVWMTDHDPFARMRGSHGIRLRPDSSLIELRARLHNRTDLPQTFLWWANVAARAHERYEAFFPTDVRYVADHARRAVTAFPRADRPYYGVDYPAKVSEEHPDADRLDIYTSITVPTSYMVVQTRDDFFGGYDHDKQAGFVHWADRRIAPGKKLWTWGNSPFGHAWDAHLTDGAGPYVELMAGVYTDNQPDFAYLAPGEVKTFSQYWYPITGIGPAQQATRDAAVSVEVDAGCVRIGVAATRVLPDAHVEVHLGPEQRTLHASLAPGRPLVTTLETETELAPHEVTLIVGDGEHELLRWTPRLPDDGAPEPEVATEPPLPEEINSADELYLTGVHLQQYRHPTRKPEPYWQELLRRDPDDSRAHTALSAARYERGEYSYALAHLERAVARLTFRNPNPADGEAHYRLGLVLGRLGRVNEAYDAFAKAAWDVRWAHPAGLQMALIDARAERDEEAWARLTDAVRFNADDPTCTALSVVLLRRLGRGDEAGEVLRSARQADPVDFLLSSLDGEPIDGDCLIHLDVATDLARMGEIAPAQGVFAKAADMPPRGAGSAAPLADYCAGHLAEQVGESQTAARARSRAQDRPADYVFPAGLDVYDALTTACNADPQDWRARALLGMWQYDRGRHQDALEVWRQALALGAQDPVLLRNTALATVEVEADLDTAAALYDRAIARSTDPRLWYEMDQLAARRGIDAADRLARLEPHLNELTVRDDLLVVLAGLFTATSQPERAIALLTSRPLQPWEGGEGVAVRAYARACLAQAAVEEPESALPRLEGALTPPSSLGETWHPLDDRAHLWLAIGRARSAMGDDGGARQAWQEAVAEATRGAATSTTLDGARAAAALGDRGTAETLLNSVRSRIESLRDAPPRIDYFATSLPQVLLFPESPQASIDRQRHALEEELLAAETAIGAEAEERSG